MISYIYYYSTKKYFVLRNVKNSWGNVVNGNLGVIFLNKGGGKCRSLSLRAVILKAEIRKTKQNAEIIQSILLPVKLSRYEVKNLLTEMPMQLKIKSSLLTT